MKIEIVSGMKKIILVLVALLIVATSHTKAEEIKYYPPSIGPLLGWQAGTNGFTPPDGRKNDMALSEIPDVGLSVYLPLDFVWNLGLYCDLTYNTHNYYQKYNYDSITGKYNNKEKFRYSFFSIAPSFNLCGVNLGLAFSVPISADYEGEKINNDKLQMLYELKLGYIYTFYEDNVSRMNIFVNATYALNGLYKDYKVDDPLLEKAPIVNSNNIITNYYNPRPVSIQIGVNVLFNLISVETEE